MRFSKYTLGRSQFYTRWKWLHEPSRPLRLMFHWILSAIKYLKHDNQDWVWPGIIVPMSLSLQAHFRYSWFICYHGREREHGELGAIQHGPSWHDINYQVLYSLARHLTLPFSWFYLRGICLHTACGDKPKSLITDHEMLNITKDIHLINTFFIYAIFSQVEEILVYKSQH